MRGFVSLHLRPIRQHPFRAALSVGGIAVGAALMVAMIGLFASISAGAKNVAALAGNAELEVSAPNDGGLSAGLADEVAAVPGVEVAVSIVRASVLIDGESTLLLGLDPRLAQIGGGIDPAKCLPKTLRAGPGVLVGPGMDDAKVLAVVTPTGDRRVNVLGRVACGPANKLNAGRFVAGPLPLAEELAGRPGRPDAIAIAIAPGASLDEVTTAVDTVVAGRGIVASPKLLVSQAKTMGTALQQGASVVVALALLVGGFCVFNTVSMTALERRKELATLRAIGGSRRSLFMGFMLEMALLGVVGSVVGVVIGALAGRQLIGGIPEVLTDTVGVRPTFELPRSLIATALGLGTLVTIGAAFLPARSAVRVAPVEAMRSEGPAESIQVRTSAQMVTAAVGVLLWIAGILAATLGDGAVRLGGFAVVVLGQLIWLYAGRLAIAEATAWIASRFGNAGRLAAASVARAPRRTWATVTAVTIAVVTVVATGGIAVNQVTTFTGPFKSLEKASVWVTTSSALTVPANLRFPDAIVDDIAAVDGVAEARGSQLSYTSVGKNRVLFEGFGGVSTAPAFDLLSDANKKRILDPATPSAFVSKAYASLTSTVVGDSLTLAGVNGKLRLPVLQIVDAVAPSPTGIVGVSLRIAQETFDRPGVTAVEVFGRRGVSPETLKQRLAAALANSTTPAVIETGHDYYEAATTSVKQSISIVYAMQVAVLLGTALALANALLISVLERRREMGIIRAIGTTRRQLRNMVLVESIAIGIAGIVIGTATGLVQHRIGVAAISGLVNATVRYAFTLQPVGQVLIAIGLTTVVAATVPAIRAGRTNVIEAIGYE